MTKQTDNLGFDPMVGLMIDMREAYEALARRLDILSNGDPMVGRYVENEMEQLDRIIRQGRSMANKPSDPA